MTFVPKFPWFYRRFNRGWPDEHILFWKPDADDNRRNFGIDLDASEAPVLLMRASPKNCAAWLTTERFIWDSKEGMQQFRLGQIVAIETKILERPEIPSDNPDLYKVGLRIKLTDERHHDISMPNIGVLNGFLSVFAHFARMARK